MDRVNHIYKTLDHFHFNGHMDLGPTTERGLQLPVSVVFILVCIPLVPSIVILKLGKTKIENRITKTVKSWNKNTAFEECKCPRPVR